MKKLVMDDENISSIFNNGILYKRDNNGNIIKEYLKGEYYGKGGFATCYKVYSKESKIIYMVKEIEYNDATLEEAKIHISLINNNIVKLYDYFTDEKKDKLYLLLEFCENRDLSNILKKRIRLTEIEVRYYIYNLIMALKYLHEEKNIVHCNLTTENIFLTDKLEVKLGDFGLAKRITSDYIPSNNGGTVYYMSPESFKTSKCSYKIDIWAIGIIIYNLLTGKVPFYGKEREETKQKIISENFDFPPDIVISEVAKDLIEQILKKDPKERPTLNQILKHDFFTKGIAIPKYLPKSFIDNEPSIYNIDNIIKDASKIDINNKDKESINLNGNILGQDLNFKNYNNINNQIDKNIYVKEIFMNKIFINKYGLAYILSNNFYGVCFRDNTKILCSPKTNNVLYIKNEENKIFNLNKESDITCQDQNDKERLDLEKKVKLLKYFMEKEAKNNSSNEFEKEISKDNNNYENEDDFSNGTQTYVKNYYIIENSSIVLRLNNKNIQVYFNSNEIILLSKENNEATFIKKDKSELKSNVFQFDNAKETQNEEIIKKLQYIKSLLGKIMNEDYSINKNI